MIRFGVKLGIASSAVYYLNSEGVWKDSEESSKACKKLQGFLSPYTEYAISQIPFEIPKPVGSNQVTYFTSHYWNKGVMTTFDFFIDLPSHFGEWIDKGIETAIQNIHLKNFINEYISPTENVEQK